MNKPNIFSAGKWQYHPVLKCELIYPQHCPGRMAVVVLNGQDYAAIDKRGIYAACEASLRRAYPNCQIDCLTIIDGDLEMDVPPDEGRANLNKALEALKNTRDFICRFDEMDDGEIAMSKKLSDLIAELEEVK